MLFRTITVEGVQWHVAPSGFITQYDLDEFALVFTSGDAGAPVTRVTRYSPAGARSREQAFAELTDEQLQRLLRESQPSFTSPEAHYAR